MNEKILINVFVNNLLSATLVIGVRKITLTINEDEIGKPKQNCNRYGRRLRELDLQSLKNLQKIALKQLLWGVINKS